MTGPDCPAANPAEGLGDRATLPDAVSALAAESGSYWWLESSAPPRRHFLRLCRPPKAKIGHAEIDDDGAELNLRSYNASTRGQPLHAYLVEGDGVDDAGLLLTGPLSGFHVHIRKDLGDVAAPDELSGVLGDRVYLVERVQSAAGRTNRFVVGPMGPAAVNAAAGNFAAAWQARLLPGVALLGGSGDALANAIDTFLVAGDPACLTAPPEVEPRDFLLSCPCVDASCFRDTFVDPRWRAIGDALFARLAQTRADSSDWPPLLRFVRACSAAGVREFLVEGAVLDVHPLDVTAQTMVLGIDHDSPLSTYRQWLLFDAPLDRAGWRAQVVGQQRALFLAGLSSDLGWQRVSRDFFGDDEVPEATGARLPWHEIDSAAWQGGFAGRVFRRSPENGDDFDVWLSWLTEMREGEQRAGFPETLALLAHLRTLARQTPAPAAWLSPVRDLIADSRATGDAPNTWVFQHDRFLRELARRLIAPALWVLHRRRSAFPNTLVRNSTYALLAFFLETGRAGKASSDWLRLELGNFVRPWLVDALGHEEFIEDTAEPVTAIRLPRSLAAAGLARLLLPPSRLRSGGFRLGESWLNSPAHTL